MKTTRLSVSALGLSVIWSISTEAQQAPPPTEPPSPPLETVLELDADERMQFFDQRLTLHCAACHTSEMIEQQRLSLAQWKAEVTKMIGWGATLPKDYTDLMAEHLHARYPAEAAAPRLPTIDPALALEESRQHDTALVTDQERENEDAAAVFRNNCANCHGPEGEGNEIGNRLVSRPILTRPEEFAHFVEAGRGRMPAFGRTIPADDVRKLRRWLLGRSENWSVAE